ncbi:MAG: hypothetical protein CR981_03415 [Proteobacteria bacterium]|nr:MAG: hypothetical protein CR981_03415 [Pseudomonadota bacterium]
MLVKELFVDISVMHKQGRSIRAIARELNISRNSVRKYLRKPEVPAPPTICSWSEARSLQALPVGAH